MLKLLAFLGAIVAASASDVVTLGDNNFVDSLADEGLALVEFYAPWCGHCKKLAPEFETAATALKYNDPPILLAKVDCTEEGKDVCSQYDVKGFPTLKAFKNGEVAFEYQGPRDADGIVKYMRSKAGPTSKDLTSVEVAEKFLGGSETAVVGFFESATSDSFKQFQKLADAQSEDFRFAHTTDAAVLAKYGFKDNVIIARPQRLQSKFEAAQLKYEGDISVNKLKVWVNDNIHGLAGHRTSGNQEQFRKPLVTAYYDVDYVKNTKGTNYWRNRVMKVAKKFEEAGTSVYFAIASSQDFSHELSEFGVEGNMAGDKPIIGARDSKDQKYVMEDEFSMDNLEQFVNELLDGKLKAYMKSEPIPEDNDGPVKVVVAENFDEIVNDENRDVLIEFYAPWCGHCKNLVPIYEELGTKLGAEDSVVIAKMDATANDVPGNYEVKGFPTIFYAPKNNKSNPKKYEGGREVKDFLKYLAKESTDGLDGFDRSGKKKKSDL